MPDVCPRDIFVRLEGPTQLIVPCLGQKQGRREGGGSWGGLKVRLLTASVPVRVRPLHQVGTDPALQVGPEKYSK